MNTIDYQTKPLNTNDYDSYTTEQLDSIRCKRCGNGDVYHADNDMYCYTCNFTWETNNVPLGEMPTQRMFKMVDSRIMFLVLVACLFVFGLF